MSVPTAVFLDTSILDGQQYNYSSTALSTFIPVCAKRGMTFLLPEPTEREIQRHIRDRSLQALAALEDARRKAPFLAKWRALPQNPRSPSSEEWEVHRIANQEWAAFLRQFKVVRLGYDTLDVSLVMRWYDQVEAPFREGKKRKEFPDAFAIAMLSAFAKSSGVHIAVVAADDDFKLACGRFGSLLHFGSLPRLTELLLSDDQRVTTLRTAMESQKEVIEAAIFAATSELSFYHVEEKLEIGEMTFHGVSADDLSIVAIGDGEVTITFTATLSLESQVVWEQPDGQEGRDVSEDVPLSGTAKVTYSDGAETLTGVPFILFDELEVALTETPFYFW
jgi:hypothetical protein